MPAEYYKESQLITLPSKASLRVLLMLGGPCTVGPGSAPVAVLDTGAARANPEDQFMLLEAQRFVEQLAGDIRSSGASLCLSLTSLSLNCPHGDQSAFTVDLACQRRPKR